MRSALVFASLLALSLPAVAQPKEQNTDMASFEKDIDALFVKGGLTADAAAARSIKASPGETVTSLRWSSAAEVEVETCNFDNVSRNSTSAANCPHCVTNSRRSEIASPQFCLKLSMAASRMTRS